MCTRRANRWSHYPDFVLTRRVRLGAVVIALSIAGSLLRPAYSAVIDPLANGPTDPNLFEPVSRPSPLGRGQGEGAPVADDSPAPAPPAGHANQSHLRRSVRPADFQTNK